MKKKKDKNNNMKIYAFIFVIIIFVAVYFFFTSPTVDTVSLTGFASELTVDEGIQGSAGVAAIPASV